MVIKRGEVHSTVRIEKVIGVEDCVCISLCYVLQCDSTPYYIGVKIGYLWKTQSIVINLF